MTDMHLDDVEAGMALNTNVTDHKGHVLLKEGVTLTARHLGLLRAHGVINVDITTPGKDAPKESTMSADEAAALVDRQFQNTDTEHPLIAELMRICRARRESGTGDSSDDD